MENVNLEEFVTPVAYRKVMATPVVTKDELLKLAKPADILLVGISNSLIAKIKGTPLKYFQGTPYVSSKIITYNRLVVGYGVSVLDRDIYRIRSMKFSDYLNYFNNLCLIRYPDLTPIQKKKIDKYIMQRIGTPYAKLQLIITALNRFIPFLKLKIKRGEYDESKLELYKEALICSTIISLAYIYGANVKFTKDPLDAWPRDFLISPYTVGVGRIGGM